MALLSELEFSFLYLLQTWHSPVLDRLMSGISTLGNGGLCFILLGLVLLCFRKTRRMGAAVLLSLLAGLLVGNLGLKPLVMRRRPCWIDESVPLLLSVPKDYSFPSGHSLAAFETAVSIFLYHRRAGVVMLLFAALMAFSRMYLFVHFPTDVLAGILLGTFLAWFVHLALEKWTKYVILKTRSKKE